MTQIELDNGVSKKYKVKAFCNITTYVKELEGHLPGLYYLVSWKGYPKEENTWKPALAVLPFCKLISTYYRDYFDKPTTTSLPIDSAWLMARPTVKPKAKPSSTKQKCGWPAKANGTNKHAKKSWTLSFYLVFSPISIASKRFFQ